MRELTYAQALREAIREEMERDARVYLMGEDIGIYGGGFDVTLGLIEQFGAKRVMDTPISEAAFVGAAVGSALTGLRPVVEIMFSDFLAVCYDQIINQAAKMRYMSGGVMRVPLVIRTAAGGGTGAAAQHSQSLEVLFAHIPGLKVAVPATPHDAKGLLKTAIRDDNPVIFLEQKLLYAEQGPVPEEEYCIPFGVADEKRAGDDIAIITYGRTVHMALEAAQMLQQEGVDAGVLDLRTLYPLDTDAILRAAKHTGRVLIVHEAVEFCGFGAQIAAVIAQSEAIRALKAPIKRLGAAHCPTPFSQELEKRALPNVEEIVRAARELMKR